MNWLNENDLEYHRTHPYGVCGCGEALEDDGSCWICDTGIDEPYAVLRPVQDVPVTGEIL
jgi:hypothetical protein